jgi:hypothetical protein
MANLQKVYWPKSQWSYLLGDTLPLSMEQKQLFEYQHLLLLRDICGLYYKTITIVIWRS